MIVPQKKIKQQNAKFASPITNYELRKILEFNTKTGLFYWKRAIGNIKKGAVAGSKEKQGYTVIVINYKHYKAHRLAWLYVYGYFPENQIDHINRKRDDNRISNLREVTQQCNSRNSKIAKNNSSGITGVSLSKIDNSWKANIMVNKKAISLGTHLTQFEAVKARWEAEVKYDFPNCCTTSSAYKFLKEQGGER